MTQPGAGSGQPAANPQTAANERARTLLDPSSPNYLGPGYKSFMGPDGALQLKLVDPEAQNAWKVASGAGGGPVQPTIPTLADLTQAAAPAAAPRAPLSAAQNLGNAAPMSTAGFVAPMAAQRPAMVVAAPQMAPNLMPVGVLGAGGPNAVGGATSANPEAGGPAEVDRAKIDALLGNVNKATGGLAALAASEDQYSAAQAQLAQGTAAVQANTLALARSGNRRDSAALGAQALQRNVELGGEATRSAAALRAQEEDQNRRLKLDAFKAAGDLGLNTAALEVDVNSLNMTAATSYLNNLFETNRLGLQLDEAEAARVTNFIRDMALVEKDYYALSAAERQSFRDDLTRRYGIDKGTALALKQLDKSDDLNWGQLATGFVSGAAQGGTSALAALSDQDSKEKTSDATAKTGVDNQAENELAELMTSVGAKTWEYKNPAAHGAGRFAGPMAQDLLKTKVGKSIVTERGKDGYLRVDGGRAGLAALSAVSMVYARLRDLEEAAK